MKPMIIKCFSHIKLFSFILTTLLFSCKESSNKKVLKIKNTNTPLFNEVSYKKTNIKFINEIPESSAMNSMVYEYFYNGGGVAIGDINNDGLADIYFTSNLKDNKLYLNEGNFKFKDVTNQAKVKGAFGWTTGAAMVDINADGWLDIYVCKSGKGKAKNRQNELFINNKNGTFTESAKLYGLNFSGYSTQAAFFDFDKDGDLDMFLLNHNVTPINTNNPERFKTEHSNLVGDKLYRNDNGNFIDISKEAGLINNILGFGLGVSIGDLNQDGWPDIYIANDYIEQDYLYYNNGDGTFREALKMSMNHTSNFSMGTDIADFNNDGLLDVISLDMTAEDNYGIKTSMSAMNPKAFNHAVKHGFHYQYMYNALQLNRGLENFSEIAQLAGVSSTDWSWAPLFADFDNDGLKDLFITNGLKRDFRNNDYRTQKLKRLEQAKNQGENMPSVIKELVLKTPQRKTLNYLFKNNGNLTFTKASKSWGINTPTFSNGAAYADLDNDGDLDLVINNIDEEASVLRNNSSKNYLQLQFKGYAKNPYGIGVRVKVQTKQGEQLLENYPTRGYQSSVQPILNIGLNDLHTVEKVIVTWPNGKEEVLRNIDANQKLTIQYENASHKVSSKTYLDKKILKNITAISKLSHKHKENEYDDFIKESLLPHKMSQFGPALAVGDINNDNLEDFFIGGAKGFSGALYVQKADGTFETFNTHVWENDKIYEDIDAVFFDADNDNDLDLYVVSGGNAWKENSTKYQDRLYLNTNGTFKKSHKILPKLNTSGSCVKPYDFDNDGDLDLFIGGRLLGQKYPLPGISTLLENNNGKFKNVTKTIAQDIENVGMVTDAIWTDFDNDNQTDLIVIGEWMPITFFKNDHGSFKHYESTLKTITGWWNSINQGDFDNDGDMDYVVGNLGLNYKYKASNEEPFNIYADDFDKNGSLDIVLGYHNQGELFPLRGRECTSNQMPFIKKKFPDYDSFGKANLIQVYGEDNLLNALHYSVNNFASVYIQNNGDGTFTLRQLPNEAQFSSINSIIINDFDNDSNLDILVAGNLYQSEVETPRNDAGYGMLLEGNGKGDFIPINSKVSEIYIKGDVKKISPIFVQKQLCLLIGKNNDSLSLLQTIKK